MKAAGGGSFAAGAAAAAIAGGGGGDGEGTGAAGALAAVSESSSLSLVALTAPIDPKSPLARAPWAGWGSLAAAGEGARSSLMARQPSIESGTG